VLRDRVSSSTHSALFITLLAVLFAILEAAFAGSSGHGNQGVFSTRIGRRVQGDRASVREHDRHKLLVTFEVNAPIMRRIDSGEKFDVAIITPKEISG